MLELCDISFSYSPSSPKILDTFSYAFHSSKIYWLCGENATGKTSLAKLMCRLLQPNSGNLFLNGQNLQTMSLAITSQKIGYLFQNPEHQLFAPSVLYELQFPFEILGQYKEKEQQKVEAILDAFGLRQLATQSPFSLSGGEQQKLALATLLIRDVQVLILDEPSAALDELAKKDLCSLLKDFTSRGGILIVISHDSEFMRMLSPHECIESTQFFQGSSNES